MRYLLAAFISIPSNPAFKESSAELANLWIIFLISSSVSSWIFRVEFPVGATGSNPVYCFEARAPPWWSWFIAKAPWALIIFALSSKEGISLSLYALGWFSWVIPSWHIAVAPNI